MARIIVLSASGFLNELPSGRTMFIIADIWVFNENDYNLLKDSESTGIIKLINGEIILKNLEDINTDNGK